MDASCKFYCEKALEKVKNSNRSFRNGFLLLFDIKDSTQRKKQQAAHWFAHMDAFYRGVRNLARHIYITHRNEFGGSLDDKDRRLVVKFIGDSGFVFIPTSYAASPDADAKPHPKHAAAVVQLAHAFQKATHAAPDLGGMRLKAVVTYLTGLRHVGFDPDDQMGAPEIDILGRGIDFTFRLEKFADDSYIVANALLVDVLKSIPQAQRDEDDKTYPRVDIGATSYHLIECKKQVKGWDRGDGEKFYLLASEGLEGWSPPKPSPHRADVEAELVAYQLVLRREKQSTALNVAAKDELWAVEAPAPLGEETP